MDVLGVSEWNLDGVLDDMQQIHASMKDRQFAFILGAGASVTSGIPTGKHLAQKWLKDLYRRECLDGASIEQWIKICGINDPLLTMETAAEFYPQIFERRFEADREAGYAELEVAMEGKSPSLGYSLLAEIIQHTRHKVVVTTNFDNLVADALAMHAHQSPLVVAHESLAGFVRPQMRRPLVAKIHRDLYLHPKNDTVGVSTLELGWKIALKKLFQYFTPVVIGYGGNDGSLMDMLMGLEEGDIAGRIVWCYREGSPPPEKALSVLQKHRGILVKIPGFDQFMLRLAASLVTDFDVAAIAERTAELGQLRAARYREQATQLRDASSIGDPAAQRTGEVMTQSVRSTQSWWAWELKADNEKDLEKRRQIYLEGIKNFPTSADLIGNYAMFLELDVEEYDAAGQQYKKAIELSPDDVQWLGRYASFLEDHTDDYDAAESLYKRAIDIDGTHGNNLATYATFLAVRRKDNQAAESLFKQAMRLDSTNGWATCSYGYFLQNSMLDLDSAEAMFTKAYELTPESVWIIGTYARFLAKIRKDFVSAEQLFKKAFKISPGDSWITDLWTNFQLSVGDESAADDIEHSDGDTDK